MNILGRDNRCYSASSYKNCGDYQTRNGGARDRVKKEHGRILAPLLLAFLAFLYISPAEATSPTLTGTALSYIPNFGGTSLVVDIGSPAAGTLVVLAVECYDIANASPQTLPTPSGWTQENHQTSGDTYGDQAVYWKIASGSEGATLTFASTGGSSECTSSYWKFTGYNSSDPLDSTHLAWAGNSTLDPPSQSVASGPRDVYVMAYAHSRGDEAYASGSDLTTNAHLDGDGTAATRSVAVSYGAYSAISSKDPGAFVFGSSNRVGSALTIVVYPAAVTPTFSAAPAIGTRTTSSIPVTATSACADCTFYGVAETDGLGTPTCTQIKAGKGADGNSAYKSFSVAMTTNVQATGTFSSYTDGTVRDGYFCMNSTAGGDSAISAIADMYKIPAFTTPLTVASQTDTVFTSNSKTLDGPGTVTWVRCPAGGTAPNVSQVELHSGACITDYNTDDATGSMTLTVASRTPNNDLYYVGTYGGQHEAAVHTLAGEFLDAPTGFGQIVIATNSPVAPCSDFNTLYSPTIGINTVIEFPLAPTSGNTIAPGLLTVGNDCAASFNPLGDLTRRGFENWSVFTGGGTLHAQDIDLWLYDPSIIAPSASLSLSSPIYVLKTGTAIGSSPNPAITIWEPAPSTTRLCYHPRGDAVTRTNELGTEPSGISLVSGSYTGTPDTEDEAGVILKMRCTSDTTGGYVEFPISIYPLTTLTLPDCTTVATDISDCEGQILAIFHGAIVLTLSGTGNVTTESPAGGSEVAPYATVSLTGAPEAPNCLARTVAVCTDLMLGISLSATLNASTGCTSTASVIYSQAPAVAVLINNVATFVLTVFCR